MFIAFARVIPAAARLLLAAAACALLPGGASGAESLNVRYTWKLKGEYAPFYVAKDQGFFEREGLDVRLGEGAGAPAALATLLQGKDDVVVLPAIFALSAINKGIPIKLIAVYHPKTPVGLISWSDNPIRVPKDLEGKTVATSVGDTATAYLSFFCAINKIDCGKIKQLGVDPQARAALFLQRKVDAMGVYTNANLPVIMEKESVGGSKIVLFELNQHGLAVPGLAMVATDDLIARRGPALRKLLKAVGEGVESMKRDPARAATMMSNNWPGHPDQAAVLTQVKVTADAIPSYPGHPIGWVDTKVIADALDMLKSTGELTVTKAPEAYFTNQLLMPGK